MTVIERWTIEGAAPDTRALINVAGPMIPPHAQRGMVLESDYEALAEQLQGAVDEAAALRGLLASFADGIEHLLPESAASIRRQIAQLAGVRCMDCGATRPQDVIDCPNCDVPRGHVHGGRGSSPSQSLAKETE